MLGTEAAGGWYRDAVVEGGQVVGEFPVTVVTESLAAVGGGLPQMDTGFHGLLFPFP